MSTVFDTESGQTYKVEGIVPDYISNGDQVKLVGLTRNGEECGASVGIFHTRNGHAGKINEYYVYTYRPEHHAFVEYPAVW